jgi:hypothetical protein
MVAARDFPGGRLKVWQAAAENLADVGGVLDHHSAIAALALNENLRERITNPPANLCAIIVERAFP